MIQTDGIRTIANPGPVPQHPAERLIEQAIDTMASKIDNASRDLDILLHPSRGPQANGQDWSDDACACGGKICDSPAGDKCWDCFNFDSYETDDHGQL